MPVGLNGQRSRRLRYLRRDQDGEDGRAASRILDAATVHWMTYGNLERLDQTVTGRAPSAVRRRDSTSSSSGPVMKVVPRAMMTMIANTFWERMPRS